MGLFDLFKKKPRKEAVRSMDLERIEVIRSKLETLSENRHSCEFLVGNEMFSSVFIKVTGKRFLTDLMIPLAGNTLLSPGQNLRIGFLEKMMPYTMVCRFVGREEDEGFESLAFNIPDQIRYSNRRSYYRIIPEKDDKLRILFDLGLSQIMDANIVNISGGGIAVKSKLTNFLQLGAEIDRIDIIFPDGSWVSCNGKVVRLKGRIMGIKLVNIAFNDRRRIIRYVTEKHQTEIAKHAGNE